MQKKRKAATLLLICLVMASQATTAIGSSLTELRNRQTQLNNQTQKTKDDLSTIKTEKTGLEAELLQLDIELETVSAEYFKTNTELENTTALLAQTEQELAEAEAQYDAQYAAFRERVRYMYENGNIGYLEVLMDSSNFTDFLNRMEYVDRLVEYDKNLMTRLAATERTIAAKVVEIGIKKEEVTALAAQLEHQKHALEESSSAKSAAVLKLGQDEKAALQQLQDFVDANEEIAAAIKKEEDAQAAAKRAAAEAAAAAAARTAAAMPKVSYDGQMKWPVPSSSRISSGYGPRKSPISGKSEFHTGIDIPASSGSNIVAADSGTVVSSGWMNGYGYTVVLNHGGGITTLYGHASKLLVSKGQTVTKGQVIALIGSTGWSTGPHLHFQVMKNGGHVSPSNFLNY